MMTQLVHFEILRMLVKEYMLYFSVEPSLDEAADSCESASTISKLKWKDYISKHKLWWLPKTMNGYID